MTNKILNAVALLSLTAFSLNSQAAYTYYLQMEDGAGGLPKGSIAFVDKSTSTPPVDNGGNGNDGTVTEPEPTNPEEPIEPEEPEWPGDLMCQINTQKAGAYTFSNYPDVYNDGFTYNEADKTCTIKITIPKAKTSSCGYAGDYIQELKSVYNTYDIDKVEAIARGTCSDSTAQEFNPI